ncbi:class I SAM-dependent methyltransferase [Bacillus massiliigorillae]|uniref:class I SAM-dependent methyltransferase n=1 Tax=Bacillus massiliigorillae TaxID=1243664 RepID=UPI0003A2617B|nr:SAM-dependent methyltransferase [Bacillus massiliigorillae]
MENNKESLTALVSCFARGYHALQSKNPIFNDTLALSLIKEDEQELIATNWANAYHFFHPEPSNAPLTTDEKLSWVMNTQCIPQLVSRSRYAEDQLISAIKRGIKQYVILGAGMDTFAYRQENLPEDFMIYEVDHPATQQFKQQRLKEMGILIPENVKFVPVDFTHRSLQHELMKHGFNKDAFSYFSILGVVMYLNKPDFFKLLSTIAEIAPNGSSVVFDYLDNDAFNDDCASDKIMKMRQITAATGEHIITGFDPLTLDIELQNSQMLLYENLSPEQIEDMFFSTREDEMHAFDHFHFAHLAIRK